MDVYIFVILSRQYPRNDHYENWHVYVFFCGEEFYYTQLTTCIQNPGLFKMYFTAYTQKAKKFPFDEMFGDEICIRWDAVAMKVPAMKCWRRNFRTRVSCTYLGEKAQH